MRHPLRLLVTLGPASWHQAHALREAGATAFRINASHLPAVELADALSNVRRLVPDADLVVDLQGAKMRLGAMAPHDVAPGERLALGLDVSSAMVPVPHPELFAQVRVGDTISVDDGRVRLRVERAARERLDAIVLDAGRLQPRKGVNVVEHPVLLDGLTPGDRAAIAASLPRGVRTFAFSFMSDGREAAWVKEAAPACAVVGKVERREAAAALDALARRVDEVWICRGDLGAQLGPAQLGRFVASVDPRGLPVPALMAGQVLEHLTAHRDPTRSEVCHLFDLVARGYAGLVLSDETAIGTDPIHATAVAASLLAEFGSSRE